MIIVTAYLNLKPGFKEEVIRDTRIIVEETRKETGNIKYTLYASTENDRELVFYEEWESKEALQAHMKTSHFALFQNIEKKYLTEKLDVNVYEVEE